MAIQGEHIVFKHFDILVRRLAESGENPIFFAVATRAMCSSEPGVCHSYELVVLKLLGSESGIA